MAHDHHHHSGHDHGHDHGHAHDHAGSGGTGAPPRGWLRHNLRFLVAAVVVAAAGLSACLVLVGPGQAVVVTRFGDPIRVLTRPGLSWKVPAPVENKIDVDLRLRTTSSGLQDVGTRDGLRILVQAYVAWQVPQDADHIRQFLRAVRNQPDIAASQLRSFVGSALEITASSFDLATLVNTDAQKIQLDQFEQRLRERLDEQALKVYGVTIRQVGIERLTLPTETLNATVERMKAERATVAAERSAEGQRAAAEITSNADRDARVLLAKSKAEASEIDAKSRVEAADIYAKAYNGDPALYTLLRSLDTLDQVIGSNTRLILRTDAAPFRVLVDGPDSAAPAPSPAPAPGPRKVP
jgi:membrane protease subunit HflC